MSHNEEVCDLYRSPSIVKIVAFKRLWWAGHVARMKWHKEYIQNLGEETWKTSAMKNKKGMEG